MHTERFQRLCSKSAWMCELKTKKKKKIFFPKSEQYFLFWLRFGIWICMSGLFVKSFFDELSPRGVCVCARAGP